MATQQSVCCITLTSGADLSAAANHFKIVTLNASGEVVLASTAAHTFMGVLQNRPGLGEAAEVAIPTASGILKVQADAALGTEGTLVTSSADGQAAAASAGERVLGVTLTTTAAAGELVEILPATIQLET